MRILHIASFIGNIGDNASHIGFSNILDSLNVSYQVERLEIRRFYKRYVKDDALDFDESMARKFNCFDIVVIGGGGFLDYWVDNSKSGTTLDFDSEFISLITTKVLIASVGAYPHREVPIGNIELFKTFINSLMSSKNFKVFLRNDGSLPHLVKSVDDRIQGEVTELADHAFFYNENKLKESRLKDINYVAVNISDDQLDMNNIYDCSVNKDKYISEISKLIIHIYEEFGYKTILIPHIHQDLRIIDRILSSLDVDFLRSNVFIAPCLQTDVGAEEVLSYYKHAQLVIASRFHAAVISLVFQKKVINVSALDRVHYLFKSMSNSDYSFYPSEVDCGSLSESIKKLLDDELFLTQSQSYCKKIKSKTLTEYKSLFSDWKFI